MNILPREQRAKHYTRSIFLDTGAGRDSTLFVQQVISSPTMAIAGYILGLDHPFMKDSQRELGRTEQLKLVKQIQAQRQSKNVLDVGCGRGQLEAILASLNISFVAIDFSEDAVKLTKETIIGWSDITISTEILDCVKLMSLKDISSLDKIFDTVVFSESIEHIPGWEFDSVLPLFIEWKARLIIANWVEKHPIQASSNWDHIRHIDDNVFDEIAKHGQTIFRQGSHLVVQF